MEFFQNQTIQKLKKVQKKKKIVVQLLHDFEKNIILNH